MQDLKAYKKCREDLLYDLLSAAGLVGSLLPAEVRPGSKFARAGGSQWHNYDLMTVSKKLQDVLYRFDQVQHALGLPHPEDARFGHPPAGSTNQPSEENPPMATPKKSGKPKAAPAPSKKPAVIDRDDAPPSRQQPKQGGGADRPTRHG